MNYLLLNDFGGKKEFRTLILLLNLIMVIFYYLGYFIILYF